MTKFSSSEAIKFGFKKTKEHFWLFLKLMLIGVAISIPSSMLSNMVKDDPHNFSLAFISGFVSIVTAVVGIIIGIGVLKVTLDVVDGKTPKLEDIFSQTHLFWRYLGASILVGLVVFGGLILLIIPGIYWAIRLSFYRYYIVEGKGVMESLHASRAITKGSVGDLLVLGFLSIGVVILGAIALGIGLLWAIPTVMIAAAFVFRKLEGTTNDASLSATPPPTSVVAS